MLNPEDSERTEKIQESIEKQHKGIPRIDGHVSPLEGTHQTPNVLNETGSRQRRIMKFPSNRDKKILKTFKQEIQINRSKKDKGVKIRLVSFISVAY